MKARCVEHRCQRVATRGEHCSAHAPRRVIAPLPVRERPVLFTTVQQGRMPGTYVESAPAPLRSRSHLALVRDLPCAYCSAPPPSDPHHYGPHGTGTKTSDYRVVPLCRVDHDRFHATRTIGVMTVEQTDAWLHEQIIRVLIARVSELELRP
jgi:hypothetical protein